MENKQYSVLKRVKKLKLPKKKYKSTALFNSLKEKIEFKSPAHKRKDLIDQQPLPRKSSRQSKRSRRNLVTAIQTAWPPATVRSFTKKDKRERRNLFPDAFSYQIFCQWVGECKRGNRRRLKRHKTPKTPRRVAYREFIKSRLWEERKNRFYQANPRQCAACSSFKHIELHHMVYGEFGKEPDEHLIPLCAVHHKGYHAKYGTQRHMIRTTQEYIAYVQASRCLTDTSRALDLSANHP